MHSTHERCTEIPGVTTHCLLVGNPTSSSSSTWLERVSSQLLDAQHCCQCVQHLHVVWRPSNDAKAVQDSSIEHEKARDCSAIYWRGGQGQVNIGGGGGGGGGG